MFNMRLNLLFSTLLFVVTFIFSFINNTWITSLIRAFIGFIIFFLLMFPIKFLIKMVVSHTTDSVSTKEQPDTSHKQNDDDTKGQKIDLTTPENNEGNLSELKQVFQPWTPSPEPSEKKSEEKEIDPQKIAQAMNHFLDD